MRPLNLVANSYAAGAEDTSVLIDNKSVMRRINRKHRVTIRKSDVCDSKFLRERLQGAVAVRHAHRADMIPFRHQKLKDHLPVFDEAFRVCSDFHPFIDECCARRDKLSKTLYFDQTHTAGSNISQAVEMT
jgi:hypothetical protein